MTTPTPLPDSSSPSLVLTHPTPEERIQTWTLNAVNWGSALSHSDYLERETYLMTVPLAHSGGITHWILVDSSLPPNSRPILASCESLRKPVLVSKNGVISHQITHGIGSVFSAPEYRGRGYASRMLRELGPILKTWQTDPNTPGMEKCSFSILYSDIGKKYYTKFGWVPFPSTHLAFPPIPPTNGTTTNGTKTSLIKPLTTTDIPPLCALDEASVENSLLSTHDGKTHVALLPTHTTMQWHHHRETFVTSKLFPSTPIIRGAISLSPPGKRIWALWTRAFYGPVEKKESGNTLYILRLVLEDERDTEENVQALKEILELARKEAGVWRVEGVSVWNPSEVVKGLVGKMGLDFQEVDREEESIASLMWYGDEEKAGKEKEREEIVWVGNEKYGWC